MDQSRGQFISKETLQFKNGQLKIVNQPFTNKISTSRYTIFNFLPKIILKLFMRHVYVFFLIISIINLVPSKPKAFKRGVFQIPLLFSIILFLGKQIVIEMCRRSSDQRINSQHASICIDQNQDKKVRYDEIKVGDILYLKRGDVVPADILLLDSLEIKDRQAITNVQTNNYDGRINTTKKKSPYITQLLSRTQQKNNWRHYKKIISGKLTIEAPNPRPKDFYGYIKLTKDPKVESLDFQNFIPRGSIIKTSGWIFGMVVYAGMKTKIMLNTHYSRIMPRTSTIELLVGYIVFISYIIWIILFILSSLAFNFILNKANINIVNPWRVFKLNILIFAFAVPISVYTLLDICNIVQIFLFKHKIQQQFSILQPSTLPNLGSLDFALLDKTGTLTTGNFIVQQIITDTSKYKLNLNILNNILDPSADLISQQIGGQSSIRQLIPSQKRKTIQNKMKAKLTRISNTFQQQDFYPKILNQFQIDDGFGLIDRLQPISQKKKQRKGFARKALQSLNLNQKHFATNLLQSQSQVNQILTSFILCHQAQIGYDNQSNTYISHSAAKQQQVLHQFSKLCGWCIQRTNTNQKILVKINTQPITFHLVGINSFTYNRRRMSIVYRQNQSDSQAIVICKAHPRKLMPLMNMTQQDHDRYQDVLADFQKKGLKPIMFGKRKLSKSQTQTYQKTYWRLKFSLISKQSDFDNLAESIENNLQLVCIVALKDEMQQGSLQLLQAMQNRGIHCWLMSGDSKQSTINVGKYLKNSKKDYKIHHITGQSQQQIKAKLLSILTQIQMLLSPQKIILQRRDKYQQVQKFQTQQNIRNLNCSLLISGQTINIIKKDQNLIKHFVYITTFCKTLLAYSLTPKHKAFFAYLIKNHYPKHPSVLAIGDSWNDVHMFQQASLSIQIISQAHRHLSTGPNAADIRVNSLKTITKMLQQLDISPFNIPMKSIMYAFYKAWLITLVIFFCNAMQLFIAKNIMSSYLLFVDSLLMLIGNALILSYMDQDFQNGQIQKFPGLFCQGKLTQSNFIIIGIRNSFIESLIHSAFIFFNTYYVQNGQTKIQKGNGLYLGLYVSTILVSSIHTGIMAQSRRIIISLCSVLWSVIIIICVTFIQSSIPYNQLHLTQQFMLLFNDFAGMISIVTNVLVCLLFSTIYRYFLSYKFLLQWVQQLSQIYPISNQIILNYVEKQKRKVIDVVRHVFKNSIDIEGSVVEISNFSTPTSFNINQMKLDSLLNIVDQTIQSKFNFQKKKQSVNKFFVTIIILSLFLIGILITAAVKQHGQSVGIMSIIYLCCLPILIIMAWFGHSIRQLTILVYILLITLKIVFEWINRQQLYLSVFTLLINNFLTINFRLKLWIVILLIGLSTCSSVLSQGLNYKYLKQMNKQLTNYFTIYATVLNIIYLVGSSTLLIYYDYQQVKSDKVDYLTQQKIQKESQHTQQILGILVPKFVQKQMQKRRFSMQKPEHKVSILFCYVCNFDSICKQEGKNVVVLLDELFRQFDQLCPGFGVQKIQTVGMTYMAATGIKACQDLMDQYVLYKQQTQRLLSMAVQMTRKTKGIMYGKNKDKQLQIKIGVHLGKAIAGVIGHHKPQFSLIGDTVNTTSRHCSKAYPKQIVVSDQAFQKLKGKVQHYIPDKVSMKGINNQKPVPIYRIAQQPPPIVKIVQKFKLAVQTLIRIQRDQSDVKRNVINLQQIISNIKQTMKNDGLHEQPQIIAQFRRDQLQPTFIPQQQDPVEQQVTLKPWKIILYLEHDQQYDKFRKWTKDRYLQRDTNFYLVIFVIYLCHSVVCLLYPQFFIQSYNTKYLLGISITRGVICGFILIGILLLRYSYQDWKFEYINIIISGCCLASCYLPLRLLNDKSNCSQLLQVIVIMESSFYLSIFKSLHIFVFFDVCLIMIGGMLIPYLAIQFYFILVGIITHTVYFSYLNFNYQIQHYNYLIKNILRKQQQKGLVSQLLPTHAFLKLKSQKIDNKLQLTDQFENVTILFADIKGFTAYSNKNHDQPEKVVQMLRRLFTDFDKCCLKFKVYKLYTIGDCYVVMGFTNAYYRNYLQQAINVINMAAAMVDIIKRTRQQMDFMQLNMRIGIHTGNIIGGIIGTDIVRYDIYGSDVLIANKFQQNGVPSLIHISQNTKILIDKQKNFPYECVPHGVVNVQKLGVKIPGYILSRKH